MVKGVRAAVAAAALGMGLIGAVGAARADIYNFSDSISDGYAIASGSFMTDQDPGSVLMAKSVTGSFVYGGDVIQITSFSNFTVSAVDDAFSLSGFDSKYGNVIFNYQAGVVSYNPDPIITNPALSSSYSDGKYTSSGYTISGGDKVQVVQTPDGPINAQQGTVGVGTSFLADLVGPSSGSSSSSSGAAPSPEVNTLLGFLVVGGTVAFIKRRRRDEDEVEGETA